MPDHKMIGIQGSKLRILEFSCQEVANALKYHPPPPKKKIPFLLLLLFIYIKITNIGENLNCFKH